MVLVIGNRDHWGRRLGASAIREGMKLAFSDMRAEKLIARIHPQNVRSLKAFELAHEIERPSSSIRSMCRGMSSR